MRQGRHNRSIFEKGLLTALVVGLLGGAVSLGVMAAFSATTQNAGNEITAGTVQVADNDNGAAAYNVGGLAPGDSVTRCIKVTYNGSLPASLRMYAAGTPGPLAPYIDLQVTQGDQATSTFPSCTGFTADGTGQVFDGTLEQLELNRTGWGSGLPVMPGSGNSFTTGSSRVIRLTATLRASTPDSAQGTSSGSHSFVWEARND